MHLKALINDNIMLILEIMMAEQVSIPCQDTPLKIDKKLTTQQYNVFLLIIH